MIEKITQKIGWSNLTIIFLFIIIFSFVFLKKYNREKNAVYTKGISQGINKGVKGNLTLDYTFSAYGDDFKGFVPSSFCSECNHKCCQVGDTVIVRYESGSPKNNDLVVKLPDGAGFSY
ncbi:hypothetical protein JN11_02093 [Mucilaginibacter frigoritolerans]|uniref:DUF3592 domain-containing protein n=1 Tax=Mucilaginibacter frigoritolerans TaxID=652788 RepID=A0A562U4S2_9SPHI|nr:hypothetical protein [Mucilaginibacter frigoritolerans]TWJ00833.1 hypothetical protein JN11_02093 [Mucilaginibacter frigoritolerans]